MTRQVLQLLIAISNSPKLYCLVYLNMYKMKFETDYKLNNRDIIHRNLD